jgi:hypothetical protein
MIATATTQSEPKPKLTQRRAAKLLGVTPWYLNRVIRGHLRSKRLTSRWQSLQQQWPDVERWAQ